MAVGVSFLAGSNIPLAISHPLAIVYNWEPSRYIDVFGAFVGDNEKVSESKLSLHEVPYTPPFKQAYFATASLDCIEYIHIFTDAETEFCWGLLLEYNNGSQRSLG